MVSILDRGASGQLHREKMFHQKRILEIRPKEGIERVKETSMRFLFLFAKRFIAGETLKEALPRIAFKRGEGFLTTTDILGESVSNPEMTKDVVSDYCTLIEALKEYHLDMNVSLKPSQLGLEISEQLCFENVCKILDRAAETKVFARIDMEGSAYTQKTLDLVERWFQGYPYVGAVIQSMLKRSVSDVDRLIKRGIGVRLCKGAYKEPAEIAFKRKEDVDKQYIELAERLLSSGIYNGIATHDERIISHVKKYVSRNNIPKKSFEFQMLYGIRQKLQKDLIREGWRVRLYMPFGDAWLPYTLRRLRERKENFWFIAKNIFRG